MYKVKSILKKTEYEVNAHELVPWLNERIAEQRRSDMATSGTKAVIAPPVTTAASASSSVTRDANAANVPDIQVIIAGDSYNSKYQKHRFKVHHAEKASAVETELRNSSSSGLPIFVVETTPKALEAMTRNTSWLSSEAALKALLSDFKEDLQFPVAQQLRDAIQRKITETGVSTKMVGLMALKEDRLFVVRVDKL